jgi:sugar phosphate isomerase/epimerase
MLYTRRDIGRIALAAGVASKLTGAAKPDSRIGNVQVGAITYSWRSMPGANDDANKVLEYCLACGISAIELMNGPAEAYAGVPNSNAGRGGGMGAPGGFPGGGRGATTPEQQAARQQAAEELKKWRLSQSMGKYKEMRKMFNDAGVSIFAHKQTPTMNMSDDEWDYFFQMGAALGADHLTIEMPEDEAFLKKLGDWALKHKMTIGYHAHTQATPTLWDKALELSKGNGINFDIGHYVGGTGESPMPIIEKHWDRITSLHLKDRKKQGTPGGDNLPWGQGNTPIKEVLQAMRKNGWKFPASIELEYRVPEGSDAVKEVIKCLEYCRAALA